MDTNELNSRLTAIGEKIKAKGWASASIDIGVSYLAMFDRPPSTLDPMIYCRPSIRASTRDNWGSPTTHEFVRDVFDIKTIDAALAKLEETAAAMPTMADEAARFQAAKEKLTDEDRRLLGVR